MIIYVIFILLILTIFAWTMLPSKILKITIGSVLTLALTGATISLTAVLHKHYGMQQITTTSEQKIYSVAGEESPAGILVISKLGKEDSKHLVMVYKNEKTGSAEPHFVPNQKNITNSIKKESSYRQANVKDATLVSKETRWRWKDDQSKRWFDFGQDGELVKQTNTVTVPKDSWLVLTNNEMEKLQSLLSKVDGSAMKEMSKLSKEEQAKMMVKMVRSELNK
ncbi:DUF4811 domain-containing protein [Pediococcus stilesii]|uniref:DUF4811 domain-containing protein n=1 Tax=Pediococcus stilesii TaxID=331679 RepID=A0A5R9BU16_9LACO|nr:DUF4811 domain-containing protein [Pediococcus stilesii]TLQ03491.1 DUF4811 domain-containing protein [Pediococcus stilesii]